jgi:hypothetical protein
MGVSLLGSQKLWQLLASLPVLRPAAIAVRRA